MRLLEQGGDVFGLPEGEPAFAGGNAEYFVHRTILPCSRCAMPSQLS
jgi:hypothetical protein